MFIFIVILSALLSSFSGLASLLLLVSAGKTGAYRNLLTPRPGLVWIMAAWLFWIPLSATWAHSPGLALEIGTLLLGLPLAWLAGRHLHEQGQLLPLLTWLVPVALLILALWGWLQGPNTLSSKPQGPFNDPNTYAGVLNLLMLPLLARYLAADLRSQSPLWRTTLLGLVGTYGLIFFLVASRGASLAVLLVLPILLWKARNAIQIKRKLALLISVLTLCYFSASAINTTSKPLADRFNRMAAVSETSIAQIDQPRWRTMSSTWTMIQDHPWLGTGLGSFQYLYPKYRNPLEIKGGNGWVHNDYLQFWQEGGLVIVVLLLCLLGWTVRRTWLDLKSPEPASLEHLGYLTAILALLLHASVNFILYFSFVAVMLGLYLAVITPATTSPPLQRPWRLLAGGYGLILGYLMLGMVLVDGLLGQKDAVQRLMNQFGKAYPVFDAGVLLSIVAPFHHGPSLVLADEMSQLWLASGKQDPNMLAGAMSELENSLRLLPCNPKATLHRLQLLSQATPPQLPATAQRYIDQALDCNPRSGLGYFYAGLIMDPQSPELALDYWRAGLAASMYGGERNMLAALLLAREIPEQKVPLERIAHELARVWLALLRDQPTGVTPTFGREMEERLRHIGGRRYEALVPPR